MNDANYRFVKIQTSDYAFAVRVNIATGLIDAAPPVAGQVVGEQADQVLEFYRWKGFTVAGADASGG